MVDLFYPSGARPSLRTGFKKLNCMAFLAERLIKWPAHLNLLILIHSFTGTSLNNSYSSLLSPDFKFLFSLISPKILFSIIVSNILNLFSSFSLIIQHSVPYVETGLTSIFYSLHLCLFFSYFRVEIF